MATSSFQALRSDRWPLAAAARAMVQALRVASVPGFIWVAGFYYPSLNLNVDLLSTLLALAEESTGIALPGEGHPGRVLTLFAPRLALGWNAGVWIAMGLPLVLLLARLIVGMARVSDPRLVEGQDALASALESGILTVDDLSRGRPQRLRTAWRAGRGLGLVAMGLWLMLVGMLIGAGLILVGPVFVLVRFLGLEDVSPLFAGVLMLPLLLLLLYAAVLMVLNQLALHSLAHNRRGVSSALTHAWRLVRSAPKSALRATAVDFALAVSVLTTHVVLATVFEASGAEWALAFVLFPLYGLAGVARAGFWARAYRSLGGMSAGDIVPGL